jgi:hypothetical protein
MKKLLTFAAMAMIAASFTACGPSAEEEKKRQDSLSALMNNTTDSLMKAMEDMAKQESINTAKVAADTPKKDSIKTK